MGSESANNLLIDANVILRFLLNDDHALFVQAKKLFQKAKRGTYTMYIEEVTIAEVVWVLTSTYEYPKTQIVDKLKKLLTPNWIVNPKKQHLIDALDLFAQHSLAYIDCWLFVISKSQNLTLTTFDKKLASLSKKVSP